MCGAGNFSKRHHENDKQYKRFIIIGIIMCKTYLRIFLYIYCAITMYNCSIPKLTLKYRPEEDDLEDPCGNLEEGETGLLRSNS